MIAAFNPAACNRVSEACYYGLGHPRARMLCFEINEVIILPADSPNAVLFPGVRRGLGYLIKPPLRKGTKLTWAKLLLRQ